MKAADFGRHIGQTYQKIDRLLDFLPSLPRKVTVASILLLGSPIIAAGFYFLVRVPAPLPEPGLPQAQDVNNNLDSFFTLNSDSDSFLTAEEEDAYISDGWRNGPDGFGYYMGIVRIDDED